MSVPEADAYVQVLGDHGLVSVTRSAQTGGFECALTRRAMQSLSMAMQCVSPRPLSTPRDLPLESWTLWELVCTLDRAGCSWRKFDSQKSDPPYTLGSALLWSTSGHSKKTVHREYITALLSLETLSRKRNPLFVCRMVEANIHILIS